VADGAVAVSHEAMSLCLLVNRQFSDWAKIIAQKKKAKPF
jgi:hypothetical protein